MIIIYLIIIMCIIIFTYSTRSTYTVHIWY